MSRLSGALEFFWDTPDDVYRRITDVTYHGQVNGTRVALSYMRPRNRGVIVQAGSALAFRGIPLQSAYCGAKHAVMGFSQSVITELRHEKSAVRVCMLQLPALNTVQFDWNDSEFDEHPMPVPPIFEPEVAARAVRYLADHPRRTMWVGASTALTIMANRLMPSLLDRYLGKTGVQEPAQQDDGPRFGSNVFVPRDDDAIAAPRACLPTRPTTVTRGRRLRCDDFRCWPPLPRSGQSPSDSGDGIVCADFWIRS